MGSGMSVKDFASANGIHESSARCILRLLVTFGYALQTGKNRWEWVCQRLTSGEMDELASKTKRRIRHGGVA